MWRRSIAAFPFALALCFSSLPTAVFALGQAGAQPGGNQPPAFQLPSGPPAGGTANVVPPPNPAEEAYLKELGRLMDDLGCQATYCHRTLPGDKRARIEPSQPLSQVLWRYYIEGRLKFTQLPSTVFGEYDPWSRTIFVNSYHQGPIGDALKRAGARQHPSETRVTGYFQAMESIQTLHHEACHLAQNEYVGVRPSDPRSETDAYRSSLHLSYQWVKNLEKQLEAAPSLDVAIRLQAACEAWRRYRHTIIEAINTSSSPPEKTVLEKPFEDSSGKEVSVDDILKEVDQISTRAEQIEATIRVLASARAKGGAYAPGADPSTIVGWEQLRERVSHLGPAASEAELDGILQKMVQGSALGYRKRTADQVLADSRSTIAQLWRENQKRQKVRDALRRLAQSPPTVAWELDPKDGFRSGADKVDVAIRSTDSLAQAIRQLRDLAERTLPPEERPQVVVKDTWTDPDGTSDEEEWTDGPPPFDVTVDKPGKYSYRLERTVYVDGKQYKAYPPLSVTVTVPGLVPEDVAGRWQGHLLIKDAVVVGRGDEKQTCQPMVDTLWRLEVDLKPTDAASGTLTASLAPLRVPKGLSVDSSPRSGTYRLVNTAFRGNFGAEEVIFPLEGQFTLEGNRWVIRGTNRASSTREGVTFTIVYSWELSRAVSTP